jgi:hypothetical protein
MEFAALIPLLLRRCVLPIACVGISISCFGQSAFFTVPSTPYDRQMTRVYPVLTSTNMQWPGPISSLAVTHWMTELRGMPYQYRRYWQTPAEVDSAQASDCKGKAVALYAQMRSYGAKNVRVVIGKHHIYDSATHAWLEWETRDGSYVLDPTFNEMPEKKAELSPMTYIPLYAYDGEHKYRAANAGFVTPTARVATGYGNHVYVPAGAGSTFAQPALGGTRSGQYSSSTTRYATLSTQRPQPDYQHSWSNVQRSSPTVQGIRQPGTIAAAPNVKYVVPAHPTTTHEQPTPNVRHSTSNAVGPRRTRSSVVSQNGNYVIRRQPSPAAARRLPPSQW